MALFPNQQNIDRAQGGGSMIMRVVLMSTNRQMYSLLLPTHMDGRFQFQDECNEGRDDLSFLHIEAVNGQWHAICTKGAFFFRGSVQRDVGYFRDNLGEDFLLIGNQMLLIHFENTDFALYTETEQAGVNLYNTYYMNGCTSITIGKHPSNDIKCADERIYISREHAEMVLRPDGWYIIDKESSNGTFLNGYGIREARFRMGDSVYIMGLQIIMGAGFVMINNADGRAEIRSPFLKLIRSARDVSSLIPPESGAGREMQLFNRLPRRKVAMETHQINIEAPPMSLNGDKIPLFLRMGGSMVMGGAAAMAGNYIMLLSTVLFPFLTNRYSEKDRKEYEARRKEKYTEYLQQKAEEIQSVRSYETRILCQNYPELNHVLQYPMKRSQLWERRKTDDDFLNIRIGSGDMPMISTIEYPAQRFEMDRDELSEQMYALAQKKVQLNNVPIVVNLIQDFVCGVLGSESDTLQFMRRLLLRLSILFSYDEVKMIFLIEPEDLHRLEFVKYLQHSWDDQKSRRFIATDPSEAYQISEFLQQVVGEDVVKPREIKEILKERPYYLVFAFSKRIFDSVEVLKDVMQQEKSCGVSVITAFADIPKETSLIFNLNSNGTHLINYLKQIERADDTFREDPCDDQLAERSIRILENTNLKVVTEAYSLPKMLTFLEMFGVGRVEHLNPLKRWHDSNPMKSLATPVGVATDGTVFMLDLHQKFQGPHGLVAGMTGSGKSEFLLTYILSLAINYHPDEVAFVLIDYKGGGLAGAFDDPSRGIHLPHLVGTITNLDGATIQRSLVSIQSELTRRQRVFNEVKNISDEGTMDIYSYQRLYRNHQVPEPMPHLFIISDEFAELKQQEPEFMDKLISIARIGRSLGIHLILATQKPAGVVNDQIRSNTKFRVCLKVQDKADSNDMLKRPEAAELKETGRFYLQVGYNEFFALGQSAWSGAPYEPQDEVVVQRDDSIQFLDITGQNMIEVRPKPKREAAQGAQLVSVVKMLSHLAEQQGIPQRRLWEPQLPKQLDTETLRPGAEEAGSIPLGLVDDPENQLQFPFCFDFLHRQHLLIVGESGSGKTMLLQSMLYEMIKRYSPEQLNFYILDYSSRMLKTFKSVPHCGGVLVEEETDSLDHFFGLINKIIEERKKLFSELEVDSYDAANSIHPLPFVVVVIDNLSGLASTKPGEKHHFALQSYLKNCGNYGVRYIVTAGHLSEVTARVKQELSERIGLHLKDKYEYFDTLNCRVDYEPPAYPGRGLINIEGRPLEIQMGMYRPDLDDKARIQELKKALAEVSERYRNCASARKLPVISETAAYEDFAQQFAPGRIPLGYSKASGKTVAFPLKQFSTLSLYFGNPYGVQPVLENFLYAIRREKMETIIIRSAADSCFDPERPEAIAPELYDGAEIYQSNQLSAQQLWQYLAKELAARNEILKEYLAEKEIEEQPTGMEAVYYQCFRERSRPLMILVENFADFSACLDMASILVFDRIFQAARKRYIYVIGCFYESDLKKDTSNILYNGFNQEQNILLFGGKLDKQSLCELPADSGKLSTMLPYNIFLMKYRDGYYPALMPCGDIEANTVDEDDLDIF